MVSSSNFDDGSMIVSVGTTDFNNYGDSDFMEMMITKDGKIDYFTLPVGKDDYQRMYKIKPSHYGTMKTQNETNESAGGDFIRTDGDGKYAESFGAEGQPIYERKYRQIVVDDKLKNKLQMLESIIKSLNEAIQGGRFDVVETEALRRAVSEVYSARDILMGGYWEAESFGAEDIDDYIQRIFTFIDEKVGTEYFGSIEDEEEVIRFKQAFMDKFNEIEEPPIIDWNEILSAESFGAELLDYPHSVSDRQKHRIRKLGGRIDKAMSRSDASRYIKSLMATPLHAETHALDCSACQGWGWNEDLNMVCDADGCIGGWVVPKKPSLLERGLELGAGLGMGMASVAIVFGILGGTVGLAAEELKNRRGE